MKEPEGEDLRAIWAVEGADTVVDEELAARVFDAVEGRLPPAELAALLTRARLEPAVAEAWRLAQAIHAEVVGVKEAPVARPRQRRRWHAGLAAGALAAAVGLFALRPAPDPAPSPIRGTRQGLESRLRGDLLDRRDPTLTWEPGPEGCTYAVTVTNSELQPIARAGGLAEPRFLLATEVLAEMTEGSVLLWRVEATLPDGARLRSTTHRAVLR